MLASSHCLNLFTKVAQFLAVGEAHEGSKDALEQDSPDASLDPEAAGVAHCQSWSLIYSGQGASEACQ
jgi:hypothetical protein